MSTPEDRLGADTHRFERTVDHHPYRCADRAHGLKVLFIYLSGKNTSILSNSGIIIISSGACKMAKLINRKARPSELFLSGLTF